MQLYATYSRVCSSMQHKHAVTAMIVFSFNKDLVHERYKAVKTLLLYAAYITVADSRTNIALEYVSPY